MAENNTDIKIVLGKNRQEILLLLVGDILGFIWSIAIVNFVRYLFLSADPGNLFDPNVLRTIIFIITFSIISFSLNDLYPGRGQTAVVELRQVARAIIFAYGVVSVYIFLEGNLLVFSRSIFLLSGIIAIFSVSIFRSIIRRDVSKYPWWGEPIVIIGKYSDINFISNKFLGCQRLGFRPVIGISIDEEMNFTNSAIPIKSWSPELLNSILSNNVKTIVLTISTNELKIKYPKIYHSIALRFEKTIFILEDSIYSTMMAKPIDIAGQPGLIAKQSLQNLQKKFAKITIEFIFSLLLVLPFLIIGLIISIIIKLDSPGPIFYSELRIGKNRQPFRLWKFRTMYINSTEILTEALKSPKVLKQWREFHKITDDPRVTMVGKLIRRFSLDELPQFYNIITGEMSLVGPRPLVEEEIDEMGDAADVILTTKPGLTGWWQVMGRNNLTFKERINYDLFYVYNWSLWTDLYIVIKTFWVVIS